MPTATVSNAIHVWQYSVNDIHVWQSSVNDSPVLMTFMFGSTVYEGTTNVRDCAALR